MNTQPTYARRLTRQYPGLFVILLDQSASMSEEVEGAEPPFMRGIKSGRPNGKYTKADIATAAINKIIHTIIDKAGTDEFTNQPKNYVYICVLGYHTQVFPLISRNNTSTDPVAVSELATRPPAGTYEQEERIQSPIGLIIKKVRRPYWITPQAGGSSTHMALAFESACAVVDRWLNASPELISPQMGRQAARRESFPPIVINITDAQNTHTYDDPVEAARRVQQRSTDFGNVLIFNCHFSAQQNPPILFPSQLGEINHLDRYANMMFEMSSIIPLPLLSEASKLVLRPLARNARGYVYNADPKALVEFLQWGTLGAGAGTAL
jgi:hypothetical protein